MEAVAKDGSPDKPLLLLIGVIMKALIVLVLIVCVAVLLSAVVDAGTRSINTYQNNVDTVVNSI
jgi:hypothetical protein